MSLFKKRQQLVSDNRINAGISDSKRIQPQKASLLVPSDRGNGSPVADA